PFAEPAEGELADAAEADDDGRAERARPRLFGRGAADRRELGVEAAPRAGGVAGARDDAGREPGDDGRPAAGLAGQGHEQVGRDAGIPERDFDPGGGFGAAR